MQWLLLPCIMTSIMFACFSKGEVHSLLSHVACLFLDACLQHLLPSFWKFPLPSMAFFLVFSPVQRGSSCRSCRDAYRTWSSRPSQPSSCPIELKLGPVAAHLLLCKADYPSEVTELRCWWVSYFNILVIVFKDLAQCLLDLGCSGKGQGERKSWRVSWFVFPFCCCNETLCPKAV